MKDNSLNYFIDSVKNIELNSEIDYNALKKVPVISMEGLPGSGKTTQILKLVNYYRSLGRKVAYIDLPQKATSIGRLTKYLHKEKEHRTSYMKKYPWVHPLFIAVEYKMKYLELASEGYDLIFLSRGILSTIMFHLEYFKKRQDTLDDAIKQMYPLLQPFGHFDLTFYLDIDPTIAHKRVIKRGRDKNRIYDEVKRMVNDKKTFDYLINSNINNLKIYSVDASQEKEQVFNEIKKIIDNEIGER